MMPLATSEDLEIFDELVSAERAIMLAEYVKRHGETAGERVAAVDQIKSARRALYALVDKLTPEQGAAYRAHRAHIFPTEDV